jgi:curved DNA-binding protein CbpA
VEIHKPKIPRLIAGVNVRALPLGPMEGFVLSRIDASATIGDIADLTSLDVEEVVRIVDKLLALGVVEWADGQMGYPKATPKSSMPPRGTPVSLSRPPPEPLQRNVTEIPQASGPADPVAQRAAVRVFAPPPPRAPQLDRLGTATEPGTPIPSPGGTTPRPRTSVTAGVHVERPTAEDHVEPRAVARPAPTPTPSRTPTPAAAAPTPAPPSPPTAAKAPSSPPPAAAPPEQKTPRPEATGAPSGPPTDGIELAMDRRKRIDDLYVALDLLDHYEVLGIGRKADKAKIRSSYFEASKAFHPDTVFRKNVGTYRTKMEAIFTRLTEAYEVLGKKKAREEYDTYLASLGETRAAEEALSGEHEVPAELREGPVAPVASPPSPAPSVPAVTPVPAPVPAAPPPPPSKQSAPTEEGRRVAREVLQKRMDAMKAQARGRASDSAASTPVPAPVTPIEPRTAKEALRDLTSSIRGAAALTGGLDQVSRNLAEARRAIDQNDLAGAVRAYRLALALAPERTDIEKELTKYANELAVSLADRYETQALYEERYKKWGSAATSWAKVIEGRPTDVNALMHAAIALVEAKGDLHQARRFAQKAAELEPTSAAARRTLGRVFLAAGLALNAKRELEQAKVMDPADELTRLLLREIETRHNP